MRLIDADEFELSMQHEWEKNNISNGTWIDIREWLKDAPTIEAEPVKHAFLLNPSPYGKCSACGELLDSRDEYKFCPRCGSKFDDTLFDHALEAKLEKEWDKED